jgi:hypothetical protein
MKTLSCNPIHILINFSGVHCVVHYHFSQLSDSVSIHVAPGLYSLWSEYHSQGDKVSIGES